MKSKIFRTGEKNYYDGMTEEDLLDILDKKIGLEISDEQIIGVSKKIIYMERSYNFKATAIVSYKEN